MGVIVPESHEKRNRKKAARRARENNSFAGMLIFIAVVVVVAFILVNTITSGSKNVSSKNSAYSGTSVSSGVSANSSEKARRGDIVLTGPVMDTAGIFNSNRTAYNALDAKLRNLSKDTGIQLVVLTVPSLNGKSIEEFSMYYAEKWQLGQKGVDNGVLLTVSLDDRLVRIENGYGTEGTLTDALSARIIRNVIVPEFRRGDYVSGITKACDNIIGILSADESLVQENVLNEEPSANNTSGSGVTFIPFAFFVFWLIYVLSMILFGRRRRHFGPFYHHHHTGGFSGHSGGGFGSGGGGGFSGGGGHFGGGGASGRW